jgi:hypothetical protein
MDSKELRLFREAYGSVYIPQTEEVVEETVAEEQLDEAGGPALPGEPGRPGTPKAPGGRPHLPGEKETPAPKKKMTLQLAGTDLFDIVKGHLMSEGYADTEEAALAIMANMSEEWRQSILLELTPLGVKTAGVVDDQRRGSNMAQDMQSIQNTLRKLKPKGPVVTPGGLPGV